ncbi:MAG: CvpA family protein [Pirellulaceae bacterium]
MGNAYDLLMLAILVTAAVWGYFKGMAWQLASILSIFVSYFVAVQARETVSNALGLDPAWGKLAAMIGIYLATSLVIWFGFSLVRKSLETMELKDWDHQVGAGLGFVKGLAFCVLVTMCAVALTKDQRRQEIVGSRSGYFISRVIHNTHAVMPEEASKAVEPYIIRYQQRVSGENPDWFEDVDGQRLDPGFMEDFEGRVMRKAQDAVQDAVENPESTQPWLKHFADQFLRQPEEQVSGFPPPTNIPAPPAD